MLKAELSQAFNELKKVIKKGENILITGDRLVSWDNISGISVPCNLGIDESIWLDFEVIQNIIAAMDDGALDLSIVHAQRTSFLQNSQTQQDSQIFKYLQIQQGACQISLKEAYSRIAIPDMADRQILAAIPGGILKQIFQQIPHVPASNLGDYVHFECDDGILAITWTNSHLFLYQSFDLTDQRFNFFFPLKYLRKILSGKPRARVCFWDLGLFFGVEIEEEIFFQYREDPPNYPVSVDFLSKQEFVGSLPLPDNIPLPQADSVRVDLFATTLVFTVHDPQAQMQIPFKIPAQGFEAHFALRGRYFEIAKSLAARGDHRLHFGSDGKKPLKVQGEGWVLLVCPLNDGNFCKRIPPKTEVVPVVVPPINDASGNIIFRGTLFRKKTDYCFVFAPGNKKRAGSLYQKVIPEKTDFEGFWYQGEKFDFLTGEKISNTAWDTMTAHFAHSPKFSPRYQAIRAA